ncbi:LapA family protein [Herbaspirillum sp. RTI4]|uniref:LapA family protein n=1 Tax=Herbaspirillum sp. RTI4 TaxID=3048640 RepID=UPI002AB44C66|nr:LapA family protein [Herbaspirillum sp. RTI4]MDY7579898.1 LapA family protein [Herbaspirillum sp. RTI4]MEA9983333.1 LapA family protein [Herbaspirillum sp. RTI4]
MKIITRLLAAIFFIIFFSFALKNTQEITLHFFLGYQRSDPLVLVLLVCFVGGVILGVLAMIPTVLRHRREASRHKKALALIAKETEAQLRAQTSPQPDNIISPQHLI